MWGKGRGILIYIDTFTGYKFVITLVTLHFSNFKTSDVRSSCLEPYRLKECFSLEFHEFSLVEEGLALYFENSVCG